MSLSIRERVPQIEVAVADNVVALVFRVLDSPSADDLDPATRVRHCSRGSLLPAAGRIGFGPLSSTPPASRSRYELPNFKVKLEFTPTDFVQINGAVNEALVARAVELLDLTPSSEVLDLYCGIGNFTLALAEIGKRAVGVEGDKGLVDRARHNAGLNEVRNAEFHVADLARPARRRSRHSAVAPRVLHPRPAGSATGGCQ